MNALDEHLGYVSDGIRLEAFRSAISRSVRGGFVVADLGCGTGILGLMCFEAGAAKLLAIDSSPMLDVARASFIRAGFGDHTYFFDSHSTRTDLPERVDLVVCDQVGYFGFDAGIVQYLADAARRFLKSDGRLIPTRIRVFAAPVSSARCYRPVSGWEAPNVPGGLRWLREHAVNTEHAVYLEREELLGSPALLGEITLGVDDPPSFSWRVELPVQRDGTLHGVAGWFECELVDGIWMTNSPLAEKRIHRPQAFLPVRQPVALQRDDTLSVAIVARPRDEIVAWTVERPGHWQFRHSTWAGTPLSRAHLTRADPGRKPTVTPEGRARMVILGYCDGTRTAREVEREVLTNHPALLPSLEETSRFVKQVLARDAGAR